MLLLFSDLICTIANISLYEEAYWIFFNAGLIVTAFFIGDIPYQVSCIFTDIKNRDIKSLLIDLVDFDTLMILSSISGLILMFIHFGFGIMSINTFIVLNSIAGILTGFFLSNSVIPVMMNGNIMIIYSILNIVMLFNSDTILNFLL